jgi:hypothetical protein
MKFTLDYCNTVENKYFIFIEVYFVVSILRKQFKKKRKIFLPIHNSFDFDVNVFKEVPNTYNLNDLSSV